MMRLVCLLILLSFALPSAADIVVPVRTIRAKEVIAPADLSIKATDIPGAISDVAELIGQEARIALYPGRPVRPGDVGPPAIVNRNDIVPLIHHRGSLRIATEGRALGRGAAGESVRIMNLSSRTTVWGRIRPDGQVEVQ